MVTVPHTRYPSNLRQNPSRVDIIKSTVNSDLEKIDESNVRKEERIKKLQLEVAEGRISPNKRASIEKEDIWHMTTGARNKYFAEKLFQSQASKQNNVTKPTPEIDQQLKIPNFVKTGSFEGLALKARRL